MHARVAVGGDGRIVVAAFAGWEAIDAPGPGPLFVADLAPTGELLDRWEPRGEPCLLDRGLDVQLDAAGTLYFLATGLLPDSADSAQWVGRWDAQGSDLGPLVHEDRGARAIAVNPRGGGALVLWAGDDGPALRRFDPDGTERWAQPLAFQGGTDARALATDCNGDALVAVDVWDGEVGRNYLSRFDDDGRELARIDLGTDYGWSFADVDTDPFGNPVLAGDASPPDGEPSFVVRKHAH